MKVWILLLFIMVGCLESQSLNQVSEEDILGEDKDKNGVRDDVDKFIEENFDGINKQNAAKQYAKYRLEGLRFRENKKKLEENSDNIIRVLDCFRILNTNKEDKDTDRKIQLLDLKILNTKERILASAQADETFAGSVVVVKFYGEEACEFEIKKE